jgi:hypothetical protein
MTQVQTSVWERGDLQGRGPLPTSTCRKRSDSFFLRGQNGTFFVPTPFRPVRTLFLSRMSGAGHF